MKILSFLAIIFLSSLSINAQNITGDWYGIIKFSGINLRAVFHISKTDSGYSSTMDSPDQHANGIPVTTTSFDNLKLKMEIPAGNFEYDGELKDTVIKGVLKQNGLTIPLDLSKTRIDSTTSKRPQEPVKPYPYYSEDVTFKNDNANITLTGTLTLPTKEGHYPAVILITGSGPQNRDEEILGHKPFLIISDYLTRNGIAVLRYDDRGTAQSTGDFKAATTADFATDVESAIAYLKTRKEINKNKIGLIGHSEGGMIAPIVASKSNDVSFIVLLAGTGIQGNKLLLLQQGLIAKASNVSNADIKKSENINRKLFDIVIQSNDNKKLKEDLIRTIDEAMKNDTTIKIPNGMTQEEYESTQVNQITNPWMEYFLKFDPATTLEKVKCPVLALNGEKDLQVPPEENLKAITAALKKGGNKNVTMREFPNLNHLFQESKTGLPSEYANIEQTFSPTALEYMIKWILNQVK